VGDQHPLIADANVLIDYMVSDRFILGLLARHVGPLYVAVPVLDKVDQLSAGECERLGMTLVDPTTEELVEAGEGRPGLAFDDTVCMILARDNHWRCVTNDRALRRACSAEGVDVLWGLEAMLLLVHAGALGAEDACVVASKIRLTNPAFITEKIVSEFRARARRASGKPERKKGGQHG
jgi:rRNA-processing protein FCF1